MDDLSAAQKRHIKGAVNVLEEVLLANKDLLREGVFESIRKEMRRRQ